MELLDANPHYAHVRLSDGRESTVSVRHLAPSPSSETLECKQEPRGAEECSETMDGADTEATDETHTNILAEPRRSGRIRRSPDRLTYE